MTAPTDTQIMLVTPPVIELAAFAAELADLLAAYPVACLRLSLATEDEADLTRAADTLRVIAHEHDVAIVIDDHFRLAEKLGLDGVHLSDGTRQYRAARDCLGKDGIVGVGCGTVRHAGLVAGEMGADYVSFGPVTASDALGDGQEAPVELFAWWAEIVEIPVVASGGLTPDKIAVLAPYADFLCLGAELWDAEDGPDAALARVMQQI